MLLLAQFNNFFVKILVFYQQKKPQNKSFKGTPTDEYLESQSKNKFQENYDCFKYRHEQNINEKALDKSKNKSVFQL